MYRRRLPHWDIVGRPVFVTFRLHGSLPSNRVFPPVRLTSGQAFVAMDKLLDRPASGPTFLRIAEVARLVQQSLFDGETRFQRYTLHAHVIMPNHVHMLVTPNVTAQHWLGPLKGFTGHQGNRLLGNRIGYFWQDESYDHLIRDNLEFDRVKRYIEWNPVTAGLSVSPEEFIWSSAAPGGNPAAGQKA